LILGLTFTIKQADTHSPHFGEAAALHVICLPETLTSQRGDKTVAGLYRYLLRQGHTAHFATVGDGLVGGLIVMRHACRQSNIFMTFYRPWDWIRAFRFLGVRKVFVQILELAELQRSARQLAPYDYIVALYVAGSSRRIGVASNMLQHAITDAKVRGVGLVVDTTLLNSPARNLYLSLGFVESHRTKLSAQFTLGLR
jgi:ribosomal protein S18 acetylase RimI-like enzyme